MSNAANNDDPKSKPKDLNGLGDNPDNSDTLDGIYD